ncbi:MAG: DUF2612 domain-containing protein [Lachnospiraceae bacterium]|nr:DUF2612 domain-containing protein [Lachnospiraceae bacterium]
MAKYAKQLITDLPEQFKGKERIEALLTAIGKQLDDVAAFYDDLNNRRSLSTSTGKQLDMLGSILGLTRAEAGELIADVDTVLDDDTYRYILGYKIMLNFGNSTYYDIVRGIRQFYNVYPIKYYESPDEPAAFTLEISADESNLIMLKNILPVKAAGVLTYYQFSLEELVIEVSDELSCYPYTGLECGIPLCGTYWTTATLGSTSEHEVDAGAETSGGTYTPDFAGTIPDIATFGSSQESEIETGNDAEGYLSDSEYTGSDDVCGTYWDTATLGNTSEQGIETSYEDSGYSYTPDFSGVLPEEATLCITQISGLDVENETEGYTNEPDITGTLPDTATLGSTEETVTELETDAYGLTNEPDLTGTVPEDATLGGERDAEADIKEAEIEAVLSSTVQSGTTYCGE